MEQSKLENGLYYVSSYSLLIHTKGGLKRIYCPFTVVCVKGVGTIAEGETLWVDQVKTNANGMLVFMIRGQPIYYSYFLIQIR